METMETTTQVNTFTKFCPNVFVAKCPNEHKRGEAIVITTKYGKEVESEVHNYMGKTKDGFYLYSITRLDGVTSQERAKRKAEALNGYAANAEKRSEAYYEASKEGADFLSLGEPIKVGHHSERRHRKLIERNWERMGKSVAESDKAKEYERRAEYWRERAEKIDLSMPDSLEYFEFELEKAKKKHQFYLDNPDKRPHSMSLQYSNKAVKELKDKVDMAIRLWGTDEEINQLDLEKQEAAKGKATKSRRKDEVISKYGGFFAFNDEQFKEGYAKAKDTFNLDEGEKVTHVGYGLYIPSRFKDPFLKEFK
jgi:hypothetical protein